MSLKALDQDMYRTVTTMANAVSIPEEQMHDVPSYNVDSVLLDTCAFQQELLFFMDDNGANDFVVLHNFSVCDWECKCTYVVSPFLVHALRINYPE